MKKVLVLLVVGLMCYASTVDALTLQAGFNKAKYADVSHIWDIPPGGGPAPGGIPIVQPVPPPALPGTPDGPYPVIYPPVLPMNPPLVGPFQNPAFAGFDQENRAVFNVTGIALEGQADYWVPGTPVTAQLSGLFYDLKLLAVYPTFDGGGAVTSLVIDMGSLGRNPIVDADGDSAVGITGGVVALYLDEPVVSLYDVISFGGPAGWVEADPGASVPGMDSYPTVNQNGEPLWLALSFTDLPPSAIAPGTPALTPGTVFRETIDLVTATGSGVGFLNVFGGSAAGQITRGGFGLSPSGVPMDVSFLSDYNFAPNPVYNPSFNPIAAAGWLNSSEDPARFVVPIPEPLTLVGMFLGVTGLGGYIRKRRVA